ncbi:MAG: hypothetical protein HY791_33340 [Deltaproteobacteria bacterium]|nr:hypothetical protein [Deltaproteobacteria bacterium]
MGPLVRNWSACLLGLTLACAQAEAPSVWVPGTTYPSEGATERGLRDVRGLVHAHSVFSHDACDDEPVKNGERDPVCFDDFRRGLCQSKHDFVFLTDHPSDFAGTPFEQALLFRSARGDELLDSNGTPVASRLKCEDGSPGAVILPGSESDLMPVGLDTHLPSGEYGARTVAGVKEMHDAGAIVLKAHTEDTNPDEVISLGLDGFEMHNLHANALRSAGVLLDLILTNSEHPEELPHPDLILVPMLDEDPRYLQTWGTVLARGHHVVTTMGSDCHRNSFRAILPDGERGDSYRRMMMGMSNHLLVRPWNDGNFGPAELKEALKSARSYGAFEVFGYPVGFDFHAEGSSGVVEMGGTTPVGSTLVVRAPTIRELNADWPSPEVTTRLLRAREGGFDEVQAAQGDLRFKAEEAGAYRAEIRMKPKHLTAHLGRYAPEVVNKDYVWVYSNAIFVD